MTPRGTRPGLSSILLIGTIAAVTEMAVVLPIQGALGASPRLVLQSIASGVQGRQAYSGGAASVVLGIAFHLLISIVAAALFVLASNRWTELRAHPVLGGTAYGLVVFAVMRFVVVPLSAVAYKQSNDWHLVATSIAVHVLAFGLPIAWMDRWVRSSGTACALTASEGS
jgi:hypothetical protein